MIISGQMGFKHGILRKIPKPHPSAARTCSGRVAAFGEDLERPHTTCRNRHPGAINCNFPVIAYYLCFALSVPACRRDHHTARATTNQPYPLPAARPAPRHTNSPLSIPRRNAATTLGPVAKHWFSSHHQLDTVQNKDKRCTIRNGVGISSSIVDCNPFILPYLSLSLSLIVNHERWSNWPLFKQLFNLSGPKLNIPNLESSTSSDCCFCCCTLHPL